MSDDLKKFEFTEYGYRGADELKKAQVKFLKGLRLR
jgi:hypothetical protein